MHRRSTKLPLTKAIAVFLLAGPSFSYSAVATVNIDKKFQTIEGFGGGFVFGVFPYGRPNKDELYDSLFNKTGVNIVRIGNVYDPKENNDVDEIPMMKEIREKWPHVKVILASWSPPPYLKSNNSIEGVINNDTATLKKNDDVYAYNEYGDYWFQSARHFQDSGVALHWISIQNEPNWPAKYEGCMFSASESSHYASYGKALNSVYNKIAAMMNPIALIGPDITGIGSNNLQKYLSSPDIQTNQLAALCHHFYNGADSASMRAVAAAYPATALFQTEFLINEGVSGKTWFNHAQLIQLSLVEEGVSMYTLFALTYKQASTHCFFSLDDSGGAAFTVRPIYYAFKHFSKSIHRGWKRVEAAVNEAGLKISAFTDSSGDSLAMVVINKNSAATTLHLSLPNQDMTGKVYQTTMDSNQTMVKKYADEGNFLGSSAITLPGRSMTTIEAPPQLPIVNTGKIPKTQQTTNRPAILRAIAQRSGAIAVSYSVPAHSPYTLSLFTMSGKRLAKFAAREANLTKAVYSFKGPFAAGSYRIRLACNGSAIVYTTIISK